MTSTRRHAKLTCLLGFALAASLSGVPARAAEPTNLADAEKAPGDWLRRRA